MKSLKRIEASIELDLRDAEQLLQPVGIGQLHVVIIESPPLDVCIDVRDVRK